MAGVAQYGRVVTDWARKYPLAPRWAPAERVRLTAADGVPLAAARLEGPPGATAAVVLLHGFLNSSRSPRMYAFAREMARHVHVVALDLRGHGASGGRATLGTAEAFDVDAAVALAAGWGVPVVTLGTSMGGAAAVVHGGAHGGVAGVVAVSTPAWWGRADRPASQRLLPLINGRAGRLGAAALLRTRIAVTREPSDIAGAAARIAPAFTIVVHDPDDAYFSPSHAEHLFASAREPKDLWWLEGAGHGMDVLTPAFAQRVAAELRTRFPSPSR